MHHVYAVAPRRLGFPNGFSAPPIVLPPPFRPNLNIDSPFTIVNVSSSSTTSVTFKIIRSSVLEGVAKCTYSIVPIGGVPVEPTDFASSSFPSAQVIFNPGETEKTITITFAARATPEFNKMGRIQLSSPVNAMIIIPQLADFYIAGSNAGLNALNAGAVDGSELPLDSSKAPVTVTTAAELATALAGNAQTIILQGTFGDLNITKGGTSTFPRVIRSDIMIRDRANFGSVTISADNVVLWGLTVRGGLFYSGKSQNYVWRSWLRNNTGDVVTNNGAERDCDLAYCDITGAKDVGGINFGRITPQFARFSIRRNYIHDLVRVSNSSAQALSLGNGRNSDNSLGTITMDAGGTTIQENLFAEIHLTQSVRIRVGGVIVGYNTFAATVDDAPENRFGKGNQWIGNVFLNSPGFNIRGYGTVALGNEGLLRLCAGNYDYTDPHPSTLALGLLGNCRNTIVSRHAGRVEVGYTSDTALFKVPDYDTRLELSPTPTIYTHCTGNICAVRFVNDNSTQYAEITRTLLTKDVVGPGVIDYTPVDAVDESFTVEKNSSITFDPRENDRGANISIEDITQPSHGSAVLNFDDPPRVIYTPTTNYVGSDSFTYTISDGTTSDTATVTFTVSDTTSPVAKPDFASTVKNATIDIDVLANDLNAPMVLVDVGVTVAPTLGTVAIVAGAVRYTPNPGVTGTDRFSYTISKPDGSGTTSSTVDVTISDIDAIRYTLPEPEATRKARYTGNTYYVKPGGGNSLGTTEATAGGMAYAMANVPNWSKIIALPGDYGVIQPSTSRKVWVRAKYLCHATIDTTVAPAVVGGLQSDNAKISKMAYRTQSGFADIIIEGFVFGPSGSNGFITDSVSSIWIIGNRFYNTKGKMIQLFDSNNCVVLRNTFKCDVLECNYPGGDPADPGAHSDYAIFIGAREADSNSVYVGGNFFEGLYNQVMSVKERVGRSFIEGNCYNMVLFDTFPDDYKTASKRGTRYYAQSYLFCGQVADSKDEDVTTGPIFFRYNTCRSARAHVTFWNSQEATVDGNLFLEGDKYVLKISCSDNPAGTVNDATGRGAVCKGPRHPTNVFFRGNTIRTPNASIALGKTFCNTTKITIANNTVPTVNRPVVRLVDNVLQQTNSDPAVFTTDWPTVVHGTNSGFSGS